jgi:hypothetical protein
MVNSRFKPPPHRLVGLVAVHNAISLVLAGLNGCVFHHLHNRHLEASFGGSSFLSHVLTGIGMRQTLQWGGPPRPAGAGGAKAGAEARPTPNGGRIILNSSR